MKRLLFIIMTLVALTSCSTVKYAGTGKGVSDGGQKWRTPISFRADKSGSGGDGRMDGDYDIVSKYTLCWVQRDFREPKTRKDMIYRILYEALEEGRTVRIDVPDDWYFAYGNLFMFR